MLIQVQESGKVLDGGWEVPVSSFEILVVTCWPLVDPLLMLHDVEYMNSQNVADYVIGYPRLLPRLEGVSHLVFSHGPETVVEADGTGVPRGGVPLHLGHAERRGVRQHGREKIGSHAQTAVQVS